ncbi:hypothetical protein [Rubrivirga sp. IMCC43871]|uniref:hypothetical protein n=1 Tax=Rubrivirga sp. IMCC43871 TaxID=3391575 RepID=UPI00398FC39D
MDLTVGVGPPRSALPADLGVGLPLVKAALLYGDRVTLCSPAASLLLRLRDHAPTALADRLEVLMGLADDLGLDDAPARLAAVLAAGRVDAEVVQPLVDGWWRRYRRALADASVESGLEALAPAVAAGRLTVETLGVGAIARPTDFAQAAAETYATSVADAVERGMVTPLLDGPTADGLRLAVEAGRVGVSEPHTHRAQAGGLAAHVLQRLPLFDRATVAEVLDVRADLDPALARFRAAIDVFSADLGAAAWDPDFTVEAAGVYRTQVAPAVAEIEDAVASVGYLRELVTRYAERPGQFVPLAVPALSVALASPDVLAQTVAVTLAGGSLLANAAHAGWAVADGRREVRARRLFFVYAAGRRFGGDHSWRSTA